MHEKMKGSDFIKAHKNQKKMSKFEFSLFILIFICFLLVVFLGVKGIVTTYKYTQLQKEYLNLGNRYVEHLIKYNECLDDNMALSISQFKESNNNLLTSNPGICSFNNLTGENEYILYNGSLTNKYDSALADHIGVD